MVGLQLSFIGVENANVSKRSKSKPFFQGKRLSVRVRKNCLIDVKPLPILWQTELKPADFHVQQLGTELNNFPFPQVLGTFLS